MDASRLLHLRVAEVKYLSDLLHTVQFLHIQLRPTQKCSNVILVRGHSLEGIEYLARISVIKMVRRSVMSSVVKKSLALVSSYGSPNHCEYHQKLFGALRTG